MAKKRGPKKKLGYFGQEQEDAVRKFLASQDSHERTIIYNQYLKDPLNKMVESIIRRYKLYRDNVEFEELHMDTLGHLMEKAHKFSESRGTKAYSYYGTICKNYLLAHLIKDDKTKKQMIPYEDVHLTIIDQEKYSYELDIESNNKFNDIIEELKKSVSDMLENDESLTDNERKVGITLVRILNDWYSLFGDLSGKSNKYNKMSVVMVIRECTNLSSNEIRSAMMKYKKLYKVLKETVFMNHE